MGSLKLEGAAGSHTIQHSSPGADYAVMLPNKNITAAGVEDVIGVNQTRQNVTASRALGVTYTNTTGKPIYISAWSLTGSATGGYWNLVIDGVTKAVSNQAFTGNAIVSINHIIMDGESYSLTVGAASAPLTSWFELR